MTRPSLTITCMKSSSSYSPPNQLSGPDGLCCMKRNMRSDSAGTSDPSRIVTVVSQALGAHAVTRAADPDLAVDESEADAGDLGHAVVADRDHRCRVGGLEEAQIVGRQVHATPCYARPARALAVPGSGRCRSR